MDKKCKCNRCFVELKLTNGLCRGCGLPQLTNITRLLEKVLGFFIAPIMVSCNELMAGVEDKQPQKQRSKTLKPVFRNNWRKYLFAENQPLLLLNEDEVQATECRKCSSLVTNQVYCPNCHVIWPKWKVDREENIYLYLLSFIVGLICIHEKFMPVFKDTKQWQGNFDSMPFIGYYFYGAKTSFGNPVIDYLLSHPAYVCAVFGLAVGLMIFAYTAKEFLFASTNLDKQNSEQNSLFGLAELADDIEQAKQTNGFSYFYIAWELVKIFVETVLKRELFCSILILCLGIYFFVRFDKNLEETKTFRLDDLIGDIEEIRQRENLSCASAVVLYLQNILALVSKHKEISYQIVKGLIVSICLGLIIGWLMGKGALLMFNPSLVTYTSCVLIGGVLGLHFRSTIGFFINTAVLSRHSRFAKN